MTISFTSNGTTSQILHNGTVVHNINAGGLQNLGVSNLATEAKPLGVDQTWQNVTASRAFGTTYTNSTGRPIFIAIQGNLASASIYAVTIDGVVRNRSGAPSANGQVPMFFIVPSGSTYSAAVVSGTGSLAEWNELR